MSRLSVILLVTMVACSSTADTTTTTEVVVPARLVAVTAQGTLTTMDIEGGDRVTIVDGSDRLVLQPTWSPGGERLAWVEVVLAGGPEDVAVVTAAPDGSERTRTAVSNPPFYLSWNPSGKRLILLRNGVVELEAGAIDFAEPDPAELVIASGQPFYFAWEPDGSQILANVGVGDRLETITVDGDATSLGVSPGLFQAPAWVGERLYWARQEEGTQTLVSSDVSGGDVVELATTDGFLHFLVSPDGEKVAYRELDTSAPAVTAGFGAQASPVGELRVLDLESGEVSVVDDGNPFVFLWSPDSAKLLFLSVESPGFAWKVWHDGAVTSYQDFTPSRSLGRDYLPFFDQYAQSIELWAPDSSAFVYAGRTPSDERSRIWLQPLDGPPRPIADGIFAAFVPSS